MTTTQCRAKDSIPLIIEYNRPDGRLEHSVFAADYIMISETGPLKYTFDRQADNIGIHDNRGLYNGVFYTLFTPQSRTFTIKKYEQSAVIIDSLIVQKLASIFSINRSPIAGTLLTNQT